VPVRVAGFGRVGTTEIVDMVGATTRGPFCHHDVNASTRAHNHATDLIAAVARFIDNCYTTGCRSRDKADDEVARRRVEEKKQVGVHRTGPLPVAWR
jgi:hypothetical protein